MKVTIYQPQYFPRLHYFNRILNSDTFVILDSAQYTKSLVHLTTNGKERHSSFQSNTPLKTESKDNSLSVAVRHTGLLPINETVIDYSQKWEIKHAAVIKNNYKKADIFEEVFPEVKELLKIVYPTLADLNITTILWGLNRILDLKLKNEDLTIDKVNQKLETVQHVRLKRILRDRDTGVFRPEGEQKGTEWTTAICKAVGATEYFYGGTAQAGYMDLETYKNHGIIPVLQDWKCNNYTQQLERLGFIPNLSILDLLLNVEHSEAQEILL